MSNAIRGVRDGTGPYKGSAVKSVSDKGRRQLTGQPCPYDPKVKEILDKYRRIYKKKV